jgi:hypothetical protein
MGVVLFIVYVGGVLVVMPRCSAWRRSGVRAERGRNSCNSCNSIVEEQEVKEEKEES